MKKALLAVSFGTTHLDTLEKTIVPIENELAAAFDDRDFFRAFTSKIVIKRLGEKGTVVLSVNDSLDMLSKEGYEDVLVVATHMINGEEIEILKSEVEKKASLFKNIKISRPVLTSKEDYDQFIDAILCELPAKEEGSALVLMGHGSEHPGNAAYSQLQLMLNGAGREDVIIGTVEGYPGIDEVVVSVKKLGVKKLTCYPLLIVAGDHAKNDLSGDEEDSWKSILTKEGFETSCVLKGLGEYEGVRKLIAKHAKDEE